MKNNNRLLANFIVYNFLFLGVNYTMSTEITLIPIQTSQKELTEEQTNRWMRDIMYISSPDDIFQGEKGAFRSGAYHWTLRTHPRFTIFKQSFETGEVTEHDVSGILNNVILDHIHGMNRPFGFSFDASSDDRYVLICPYGHKSIVYDTLENQTVGYTNRENFQKEREEVKLGFDKNGNIYCGTQHISPMFLLREFPSGNVIREYRFEINYAPDKFIPVQVGEVNQFKLGINYNYLKTPLESPNGKYTVFSFTVFQFQYMYAIVLVCDNKSGQLVYKQLVSTSGWNYNSQHFAFSPDEKYFYFQDGHNEICQVDLEQRMMTSRFTTQYQPNDTIDRFVNRDFVIDSFFLAPDGNIVVQAPLGHYYYYCNPAFGPSSPSSRRPQKLTSVWNPFENTVTYPHPWVKEGAYTLRHWISSDKKIVATYSIDYDPDDYRIAYRREEAPDTLAFWDIDTGKLLQKIEGNITKVDFSPDWRFVDIISWEEGEKIIQTTTRYSLKL